MNTYNPRPDLFVTNKFTNCYFFIINRSKQYDRKKLSPNDPSFVYYENHHIIPRSLEGDNSPENLVLLTAYEHYLCHWLLTKMCRNTDHFKKLLYPLRCMTNKSRLPTLKNLARLYEASKTDLAKLSSETNLGRKHSDEFRARQRELNSGKNNRMYGKKHSTVTLEKMREAKRGKKNPNYGGITEDHKRNIGLAHKNKIISEQQKAKQRKTYKVVMPDGTTVITENGREFCKQYSLNNANFCCAAAQGKLYKGIKITYL